MLWSLLVRAGQIVWVLAMIKVLWIRANICIADQFVQPFPFSYYLHFSIELFNRMFEQFVIIEVSIKHQRKFNKIIFPLKIEKQKRQFQIARKIQEIFLKNFQLTKKN